MAEATASDDGLEIDRGFLARLILGALSDHEQRLLVARLLPRDAELRREITSALGPFAMFDLDLARAYDAALADGDPVEARRQSLLAEAAGRSGDLDELIQRFTLEDVFQVGATTRRLFTWTMAEHLLARANRRDLAEFEVRTSLHLAMMVVDVLDLLGLAGHAPRLGALVADVRRRIHAAAATLGPLRADGPAG